MPFRNVSLILVLFHGLVSTSFGEPWERHVIDDTSRGADGARLGDINQDGLPDIATGWEEGARVRTYLHPGLANVRQRWPVTTVGQVRSPEDALLCDLDQDGVLDVVSCCEGKTRAVFVHWAPSSPNAAAWTTTTLWRGDPPKLWMFAKSLQIDGVAGPDLFLGSKGSQAEIGWLANSDTPRDANTWQWHHLKRVGWIMTLDTIDMDADGDHDLLFSDRKGRQSGVFWLENPGADAAHDPFAWTSHSVGGLGKEVMFLGVGDLDQDGDLDVACATKGGPCYLFYRNSPSGDAWRSEVLPLPDSMGSGKSAVIGDFDLDGLSDVAVSCEHSEGLVGVAWFRQVRTSTHSEWEFHDVSGSTQGIKFDLLQPVDLDQDGDLDLLTCEERDNLGVIWYENPTRSPDSN